MSTDKRSVSTDLKWLPIEQAPKDTKKMFVVKAVGAKVGSFNNYNSDPYCVWSENGEFIRWPHDFRPTHFCYLPE